MSVQTVRQTAHFQFHSDARDPDAHGHELDEGGFLARVSKVVTDKSGTLTSTSFKRARVSHSREIESWRDMEHYGLKMRTTETGLTALSETSLCLLLIDSNYKCCTL